MKKPKPKKVYRYVNEIVAGREERERRKKFKIFQPKHKEWMVVLFWPCVSR